MKNPHSKEAFFSSQPVGQFIDMNFMASNSYKSASRRSWQKSLDSQEFGFASNLVDSTEVAPADELFFKGQLLPLQLDHRLHLVQALSSSCDQLMRPNIARVGSSRLADDLCKDDDVIEFNSCRLERDVSLDYLEESMHTMDHRLLNQAPPASKLEGPFYNIKPDDKLECNSKGCEERDCGACARNQMVNHSTSEHGILAWYEDEEVLHCNNMANYKLARMSDAMTDPGSSSSRSQNSGFWDSGADKDVMDSSSSRDSNGSSQDSYFQTHVEAAPPCTNASSHPHSKLSFTLPWKLALFRRGPCGKQAGTQEKVGFSEDLSKFSKAYAAPPLNEVKETLLEREANEQGSIGFNKQEKQGKSQRRLYSSSATKDGSRASLLMKSCKSSTHVCDSSVTKLSIRDVYGANSFQISTKGDVEVGATEDEMKKQRSAAVTERCQMYARRLKPLYDIKRGLIGQFRMDECGKRANCEVEHGTIYSSRPAYDQIQRRLSHHSNSSNLLKGNKLTLQQQNQATLHPKYKVLAMSSCPTSPNRSGVLAVIDTNPKINTPKPSNSCKLLNHPHKNSSASVNGACTITRKSNKSPVSALNNGTNSSSMSTMHELHSALQSAIAHCKESNMKLNYAANLQLK